MTEAFSPFDDDDAFLEVVFRYLEGELPEEQVAALDRLLATSARHRSLFNDVALQAHLLKEYSSSHDNTESDTDDGTCSVFARFGRAGTFPRRTLTIVGAALIVVLTVILALQWTRNAAPLRIAAVRGDVSITAADGVTRPARANDELVPGETISLDDASAAAALLLDSSLRISVTGPARATWSGKRGLILQEGDVEIRAGSDSPLRLSTPHASLVVADAEFHLLAADTWTEVEVRSGRVTVARDSVDEVRTVIADQVAIAQQGFPLVVRDTVERVPTEWAEDFENGLSPGWKGRFVATGLPNGSRGGVGVITETQPEGQAFLISAGDESVRVLLTEDSHFILTCRLAAPTWFNLFLLTQDVASGEPDYILNRFQTAPLVERAGRWQTVRIPIAEFDTKRDGVFTDDPPAAGNVVVGLLFSAIDNNLDLTIDEIAITSDGPGTVTFEIRED